MAYAVLRQGDIQQARALFVHSIDNTHKAGMNDALVYAVEGLASLYVNQNQSKPATRLFTWTNARREKIGNPRPPLEQKSVDRDLAVLHSKLGDAEFEKYSAEGRGMTVEQAIALALEAVK